MLKRVAHQSIGVPQKIWTTRNGGRTNHVLTVEKKGHPSHYCPEERKERKPKKKYKERDDTIISSTSSNSSRQASFDKMKNVFNKTNKQFATMETQIRELENESDSDSDITDETGSNFLILKQ